MKKVALAIAATLVLAVVSPAFSQPFADVPTDHWAFDAIAELAAKGIVEGYPDGTFKGDRAMTRYEIAMVVARLLARIEAIKIPAPTPAPKIPAPEVTRADITTLQRLINEFRAELAALGVRVTAVEEELAALRDKLDNVRISGDVRFRYNFFPSGSPSTTTGVPSVQYRNRLTFRGTVTPAVTAVARVSIGAAGGISSSSQYSFSTPGVFGTLGFDQAYLDMSLYGASWRLGRQGYTLSGTGWSGYGLLFDPGSFVGAAAIGMADGLRVDFSFGGFALQAGGFRHDGTTDIYVGRLSTGLIPGWTLGVSGMQQRRNGTAVTSPNTSDTGWSLDLRGSLIPGVSFGAAYASFVPSGATGSRAWTAWSTLNLAQLTGMRAFSPSLTLWYKDYGATTAVTAPLYTGATTEVFQTDGWNFRGWGAALGFQLTPALSGTVEYETGNRKVAPTSAVTEWYANLSYALASRTTLSFNYFRQTVAGADASNFYRIQLSYSY